MQQTARAAVLTAPKTFEIREYPIPAIGDDEMLIKVEACGVCGTDGHEYNRDPFGLCPVSYTHLLKTERGLRAPVLWCTVGRVPVWNVP